MKVLILTCNTGQGHNSTARSIAEKCAQRNIDCVIEDALAFVSPKMSDFISSWHVRIYRYVPVLFNQGYEFAEKHPSLFSDDSVAYNFFCIGVKKLRAFIESEQFDVVLCTHLFSALMISELTKDPSVHLRTGYIMTDYTCYPGTAEATVDAYFIPHETLSAEYVACGVPEDKLIASGIPVKDSFYDKGDKAEAKRALGIDPIYKHLLMMSGSMGCGPMESLAQELAASLPESVVLTVVCGTNEKLKKKLDPLASDHVRILGFTDQVSLLMDSADLYMTKAGGLSVTEAAVKRLPLVLIDAVAGCESYNRYFFLTHGMAIASNDPDRLPALVIRRLFDGERLKKQSEAMAQMFTRKAAEVICDWAEGR